MLRHEAAELRRGEFNSEWQPVQPAAQLRHRSYIAFGEREIAAAGPAALHEQPNSLRLAQALERLLINSIRKCQWRDLTDLLALHAQVLPTGRQNLKVLAAAQQIGSQVGTRLNQVLAIVEYQ